jgi:hypothetical protein
VSGPGTAPQGTVAALQTTLAAEHAAVWVLGVVGGRTSASRSKQLYDAVAGAYVAHRSRRDQLSSTIRDLGSDPVASEAAYDLPAAIDGPRPTDRQLAAAALEVERRCAATYAFLVAQTAGRERGWAVRALNEAAVRELAFRGTPEMFPGAGEYADR